MFCENCGVQLAPDGTFCGKCGAKVETTHNQSDESLQGPHHEPIGGQPQKLDKEESSKTSSKKKWLILGGVILFLALLTAGAVLFFGQNQRSERMFQEAVNQGRHYLEAMDFTNAELAFLRAIEIDPRQVEPYLALADMYIEMGEVVLALEILERGIRSVLPEDRWILEERWEEVDSLPDSIPLTSQGDADLDIDNDRYREGDRDRDRDRDEVMVHQDVPFEPCDYYLALLAYHEFLTNPQSMVLEHWGFEDYISWDTDTIRHGMLADFTGDGIPHLIILPSNDEMLWGRHPILIIGYSSEIEVLYQSSLWLEGRQSAIYEVAISSEGKSYLIRVYGSDGDSLINERYYLTLQNGVFIPVHNTVEDSIYWIDGERLDEPIEAFYVNSVEVSKDGFERAPYRYFGIVKRDSLAHWHRQGEFVGIHLLVADIEKELAAVGMMTLEEEENDILAAKRIWVEFFSSEQWREFPLFSSAIDTRHLTVIYADLDGDGVNEALLRAFTFEDGRRFGALYEHFHALLAIVDGEVTVVYSIYNLVQEEEEHDSLFIMRNLANNQFVFVREEIIGGFDGIISTIFYDYRDGEVFQRVQFEGGTWQLDNYEFWWWD